MLEKINRLTNWQAALIIAVIGFAVFFTGLNNPFQGDDINQIVNNVPVHSITHIKVFFEGGTFYNGQGNAPLIGVYYRPLMTTVFSLIYTLFGPRPIYFHLFQLLLCIGSATILYLFFRYSFKPVLALFLALVFLVHPLNSQTVYSIPALQESLFFFFGILALYLLVRFNSTKGMVAVAACLFLSLLAKETGVIFVGLSFLYLFWWDRKRLYSFLGVMALPVILYLALRIHAVGLFTHQDSSPIDSLSFGGRLLTAPSIPGFYLTKFIFPAKLATGYFWTYTSFSFRHVLLPLVIDLAIIALVIYLAFVIRRKASRSEYLTYLFFTAWATLGMLLLAQIVPLDMTACEIWFYFPMAGLLGMIGVVLTTFQHRIHPNWFFVIAILLLGLLGLRTAVRGSDWKNPYKLAQLNIVASKEDFNDDVNVAKVLIQQGKYNEAKPYVEHSIRVYPIYNNYLDLGVILTYQGDYGGAMDAYNNAIKYGGPGVNLQGVYEDMAALTLLSGNPNSNKQFLLHALQKFPQDSNLWLSLALLEARYNDNADAKVAITNAARYGQVSPVIYDNIMNNRPFNLNFGTTGKSIAIP